MFVQHVKSFSVERSNVENNIPFYFDDIFVKNCNFQNNITLLCVFITFMIFFVLLDKFMNQESHNV